MRPGFTVETWPSKRSETVRWAKTLRSSHPQAIKQQEYSRGIARGKQGEYFPPAFPLLSPCHPLAEEMPVHGLRVAEAAIIGCPSGTKTNVRAPTCPA